MFKKEIEITKFVKEKVERTQDEVLMETPIDLHVNSSPFVNIICLSKDLKELGVGFLYSIGIIDDYTEIKSIEIDESEKLISVELSKEFKLEGFEMTPVSRVIETTCGIPSPWRKSILNVLIEGEQGTHINKDIKVKPDFIYSMIKNLQQGTELFRNTGGCHGAAVFDLTGKLLSIKEDIGRHNALDKVIGEMVIKGLPLQDKVLASTGRLTGDSVLKAVRANVPIFASVSAAIESGVRLAKGYGITLIGFVRGSRMNVYCHPERIEFLNQNDLELKKPGKA